MEVGNTRVEIAQEILRQLGGNKFVAMTGAKNLAAGHNYLSMKIGRNKSACNRVTITLNSMDLYDMSFSRVCFGKRGMKETTVKEYDGLYNDMLPSTFTLHTGMYTRLF